MKRIAVNGDQAVALTWKQVNPDSLRIQSDHSPDHHRGGVLGLRCQWRGRYRVRLQ